MKKTLVKLMVPAGLLWVTCTLIISHYTSVPDFTDGYLKGFGIGLMILSLIIQAKWKRAAK